MKRKTLREQMQRKCIHFNGIGNNTCDAGCVYDEMDAGRKIAYRSALPYFKPDDDERQKLAENGVEQATCEHCRFPSDEEVQAWLDEIEEEKRKMGEAQKVIDPIRKEHKGKNWQGVLECPNCKGNLHVRHSGYNGHVHVRCETSGCVAWME